MHPLAEKHVRKFILPSIFCPGCGDGTITNCMVQIVDKMGIENFLFVGGVGCSGWIPVTLKADFIHTLHGRAPAVGTGLKLAHPDKNVMIFTGDGDCLGIGGGQFLHAARRNVDLNVIMINNMVYGMTGGQAAPTTPHGAITKTTPYGNVEDVFDTMALAKAAGATFVARSTTSNPVHLGQMMEKAILHKGFSFVEVMTQCPTQAGRNIYGSGDPAFMFNELKKRAVSDRSKPLGENQFYIGVFHQDDSKPIFKPVELKEEV